MKTTIGETVLYALRCDSQHHEGVATNLKKEIEKNFFERKLIDSRLMSARLKGKHANLTPVQC